MITGCKIIDILEAAHINPYRGEKDHHITNGLLLRADIHTLFDLDLIRINPKNFNVEISDKLIGSEYEQYNRMSLNQYEKLISIDALKSRYQSKK
ncbi:HNH endonuclease signature motif containing protein [Myroides sp. mNGS23_01]|nr:HNH endonuclease signature motif containing protein [Myroides sp. mNGS23_01]WHT40172.1 HNH endonuclease signature motif containing protein [Myroides sp. mNGS23_01]